MTKARVEVIYNHTRLGELLQFDHCTSPETTVTDGTIFRFLLAQVMS